MKIHTDTLTYHDLREAAPVGVYLTTQKCGSRKRAQGFTVFLEGSSPHKSQHDPAANAATWDEWGVWIDNLFAIEPDAIIGSYDGVEDFYIHTAKHQPKGAKAPWLGRQILPRPGVQ
jgi:hypothetical protein